jgi:hypothetical protein
MEHLEIFPKKLAKLVKITLLKKRFPKNLQFFVCPKNDKICFLKMTVPFHSTRRISIVSCIHQPTTKESIKKPKIIFFKKNSTTI